MAAVLAACSRPQQAVDPAPGPATSTVRAPADELSLSGRVTAVYGDHVFTVGSGREQVNVVVARRVPVSVGSEVEVSGRVRTFRRAELEAELGIDLAGVDSLERQSCLVATTARVH